MTYLLIALSSFLSILISYYLNKKINPQQPINNNEDMFMYFEKLKEDIKEFIENEKTQIKDIIIEFDLRLRQAKSTAESLEGFIISNQQNIKKLEEQNEFATQLSEKIHTISSQAELLNQEIEILDRGFDKIQNINELLKNLDIRSQNIEEFIHKKERDISNQLDETFSKIVDEAKLKIRDFVEKENQAIKELFQKTDSISKSIEEEKYHIELLHEKVQNFNQTLNEKFSLESVKTEEKFIELMRMYQERFKNMEVGLHQIKESAVESLRDEITRIRSEIDNFNLQTIAKRDEIINETRRMANNLVEQIQLFQEKYLNAENKLLETINKGKQEIQNKHDELLQQWGLQSRANLEELKLNISNIKEEIEQVKQDKIEGIENTFKNMLEKYESKLKKYVDEEEQRIVSVKKEYEIILDKFIDLGEQLKRNLIYTLDHLKNELQEFSEAEKEELLKAKEGFLRVREEIESKIDIIEEQIRETSRTKQKLEEITEKAIKEIKDKEDELIFSLEKRASKFIEEQDEKLGRLNQTLDEKISRQLTLLVDKGQFQIEELEKRTSSTIRKSMENMQKELTLVRNEIASMKADIINETDKVRSLKDHIFKELQEDTQRIRRFEEKLSLVDNAEDFIIKFEHGIEILTKRLNEIQSSKKELEEFIQKISNVSSIRERIEEEVKMLNERKAILDTVENRFLSLSDKLQDVEVKLVNIESADKIAEKIEQRLLKFEEYRKAFEDFFKELTERRKYIENALRSIEKSRKDAIEAGEVAKELIQKIELFEIRKDNIKDEIEHLEKKVSQLKDLDMKFNEMEARFQQIDVLMTDLEKKQTQISVMSKRLTEVSDKGGYIKNELESLVSEANEKMDKLSAFYETLERMLQEADKATKESKDVIDKSKKNLIDEWKKEGILTLYSKHKWEPELIAERLNVDISIVRAVISSVNPTYKKG